MASAPSDLDRAALPYEILDARTGRVVDRATFWAAVASARAVCVGEEHSNPHHHWFQLEVVRQLAKQLPPGTRLALGLEMVQRPFQGILDDYAAKRIDAASLQSRVGWEDRWGFDWGFYAPTIDAALGAGASLIAMNAPRELTKKIARKGLANLAPDERAQVPDLVLDDTEHRAWFDGVMEGMGGAHGHAHGSPPQDSTHANVEMPSAEDIYTVQVVWDETMADAAARWLAATPSGHAILLAGNGHCHESAIVRRLERRGVGDVISLRPVLDTEGRVADALVKPVNDYLVVLRPTGT